MRATFAAAGACTLLALAVGLGAGCGSQEPQAKPPTPAQARAALAGSPAPLASLHRQAAKLLDGGPSAYRARVARLRGHPLVVNAWASWCAPCRSEMAWFALAATRYGRRVGFLGVNSGDTTAKAESFLDDHFVPYPSYEDPHDQIANDIGVRAGLPTTVFYSRDGSVAYVKQGQYRDEAALIADVKRWTGAS